MVVEIFSIVKDQEEMLPLYFKHYNEVFSNVIFNIYNNKSTDDSVKICESQNCNIVDISYLDVPKGGSIGDFPKEFATYNERVNKYLNDREYNDTADWVLMADPDELVHITTEDLINEDADVIRFTGYQMIKNDETNLEELTLGFNDGVYNKPSLFRSSITMNFGMGAHTANPERKDGKEIKYNNKEYKLLHYQMKHHKNQELMFKANSLTFNVKIIKVK